MSRNITFFDIKRLQCRRRRHCSVAWASSVDGMELSCYQRIKITKTTLGHSMHVKDSPSRSRRLLLGGLAGAPALFGMPRVGFGGATAESAAEASAIRADQVLNVADFEALARAKLPPAHFGYVATGVDDDRTVLLNHEAYSHIEIRSRRFVDVSKLDTRCRVLGSDWKHPIYFSAVSHMRAFHPEAEVAVARAAASREIQMMLSSGASCSLEEVAAARNAPMWEQLYAT